MFMVKILRNRSVIVLIVSVLVLAGLIVAATVEREAGKKTIRQTQSIENINLLQKAMVEKDEKICDEIKGETRRDEIDYDESDVVFDKDTKAVSEAEARKRCHEAVVEVVEIDKKRRGVQ